jgi:hypothetical protein
MKLLAIRYDREGSQHREAGDVEGAVRLFERAIRHAPLWSVPWYNLGLTHKYACNWPESLRCNAEAVRLNPADEAAIWNLGIAATALGDWEEARRAWGLYGISVPEGRGPIEMNYGAVPIRINPNGDAEVVWARRIDPARAVLTSIPLPESGHRHGDLVLHDGAAAGHRERGGKEVPVFNELCILAPSTRGTFEVSIAARTSNDLAAFEEACRAEQCPSEDWSTLRVLCKECSEGTPHAHPEPQVSGEHRMAVAASNRQAVERAVSAWIAADPTRVAGAVLTRLEPLAVH